MIFGCGCQHIRKGATEDFNETTKTSEVHVKPLEASLFVALGGIRAEYSMSSMEEALTNRDIAGAIKASKIDNLELLLNGIGLDNGELVFSDEVIAAFDSGASLAAKLLPKNKAKLIGYSSLGDRTVQFLRESGAVLVRDITESTRKGVNRAIVDGLERGVSPGKQAREIRQMIGLTESQTNAVINFRQQLEQRLNNPIDAHGKPRSMTAAGARRLSATEQAQIKSHMKNGTFDQKKIDQMVDGYYGSLQNKRAKDIARTEALNAVNNGQLELWRQGVEQGVLDKKTVKKVWLVTNDSRLRASHAAIPVMNPEGVPVDGLFATPFGPVQSPGDSNRNLVNCRCALSLIGV